MSEFQAYPKIPRLNRDVIITEKIDGTNASVVIVPFDAGNEDAVANVSGFAVYAGARNGYRQPGKQDNYGFAGWVQSNAEQLVQLLGVGRHYGEWWGSGINRGYGLPKGERRFSLFNVSRWGEQEFYLDPRCAARTCTCGKPREAHTLEYVCLGPADWHTYHKGQKVCACREARPALRATLGGVLVEPVPVLYRGPWFFHPMAGPDTQLNLTWAPHWALDELRDKGSFAAPFMNPEGIVVFHTAGSVLFKATLENDEPKGAQ